MSDRPGGYTTLVCNQPPRPTQPPTLCGTGNEFRPKCSDALWLEVKAGWLIPFVEKRVGYRYNCVIQLTRAILGALEMSFIFKRYINLRFYFYFYVRSQLIAV